MDACHSLDDLTGTAGVPYTPAGHSIVFRETTQQDGSTSGGIVQRRDADMLVIVYQPVVDFVRDNKQVVFFGDFCHFDQDLA